MHAVARANKVIASREFVQRLVDQHPPTQGLMQRAFPAMLLSLLRKPSPADAPPGPNWQLFWRVASIENHHLAGLIWDESTRHQLRSCAAAAAFLSLVNFFKSFWCTLCSSAFVTHFCGSSCGPRHIKQAAVYVGSYLLS